MRWVRYFRRTRWDEERRRELQAYLDIETDENIARGMPAEDARRAALVKLGNPAAIREEIYEMNTMRWLEAPMQDLRYALRTLRKSPGFAIVAVLSLALGIGVNTAMFSVIHPVLLRPLPFADPDTLVRVTQAATGGEVTMAEFEVARAQLTIFAAVAAYRGGGTFRLRTSAEPDWITTLTVSTGFLETLGASAAMGREFSADETRAGGPLAVVITDRLWRRDFGGDPQILHRAVTLDETVYTVVGVLPPDFWFPQAVDALVPLRPTGSLGDLGTNTQLIARRAPGVTLARAQQELTSRTEAFRSAQGRNVAGNYRGVQVRTLHAWIVGDVRANLLLLFGATGLLLLISCANLAMLLMTRFAARGKEIALRLALGGRRRRLLGQFFIEHFVVAALGAGAGVLAAYGLLQAFVAWTPLDLPASTTIRVNGTVLMFTLGVSAATALVFTLVPFQTLRRLNVQDALRSASRSAGADTVRARTRNVLVVVEVALSAALLVATGLLLQSLYRLHQEPLGFVPDGLLTFQTPFSPERARDADDRLVFTRAALDRLRSLPGVQAVAATNLLPLTGRTNLPTQRDGHPEQSIGGMEIRTITPDYFEVMGIPIRQGRPFGASDTAAAAPVAIVGESVARAWWPNAQAAGDRLTIGMYEGKRLANDVTRDVVGVAANTKTASINMPPRPTVYVPVDQAASYPAGSLTFIVKADLRAVRADTIRAAMASVDGTQRIQQMRTMNEVVAATSASPRFNASLFGIFAGVALLLATVGLYGVLSFLVELRRHEIGTRLALGAARRDVVGGVLKQGLGLTALGLGLGLTAAWFLGQAFSTLLHGVKPRDPISMIAVAIVLFTVGLAASAVPALRAARTDPMAAFRSE